MIVAGIILLTLFGILGAALSNMSALDQQQQREEMRKCVSRTNGAELEPNARDYWQRPNETTSTSSRTGAGIS